MKEMEDSVKLRNRFLILATLMLISTSILSACSGGAPATAPATSSTSPTSSPTSSAPPSTTKPPATTIAPTTASTGSGKPQYGGQIIRLTGVTGADPTGWGPLPRAGATPQQPQELWARDWSL